MPSDSLEIKVSLQKLLIAVVVIIVPLNFLGLYLSSENNASLEQVIGTHFRTIAQADAGTVLQFVNDRLIDVGAIAMEPAVVDATAEANQAYGRRSAEATAANIVAIDKKWDTSAGDAVVKALLSSPVSRLLQRRREIDPRFLKIIVADENGVPIAATDKPLHYAPADNPYWQAVSAQGRGGIYVSEVVYDPDSRVDYFRIGFPIYDKGSRRFIGAASALIDVSGLFSRLSQAQLGRSARTILVREDGTVVNAPEVTTSMKLRSEEYAAARDALGTLQGRQAGYLMATMRDENRICGIRRYGAKAALSQFGLGGHGKPGRAGGSGFGSHAGTLCHFDGGDRLAHGDPVGSIFLLAPETTVGGHRSRQRRGTAAREGCLKLGFPRALSSARRNSDSAE